MKYSYAIKYSYSNNNVRAQNILQIVEKYLRSQIGVSTLRISYGISCQL